MNKLGNQLKDELSLINWTQRNQNAVLQRIQKGEPTMKQNKRSVGLILVAALLLVTVGAIATTLLFTARYDAGKLADETLLNQYGITPKMMSVLHREIIENEDGSATVLYEALEPDVRQGKNPIGIYTVSVEKGKATANWTLDGQDTSAGLEATAWGPEQLTLYVEDYAGTRHFMKDHGLLAESYEIGAIPYEDWQAAEDAKKAEVLGAAKITVAEARSIAKAALVESYQMTDVQADLLIIYEGEDDQTSYEMLNGRPVVKLVFHLSQGTEWMEKDGIYVVTINMETGAVEEIFYDSALAGNG